MKKWPCRPSGVRAVQADLLVVDRVDPMVADPVDLPEEGRAAADLVGQEVPAADQADPEARAAAALAPRQNRSLRNKSASSVRGLTRGPSKI